jgi:hypothetical protein
MISVIKLESADGREPDGMLTALRALAARPGYVRGSAARATDDVTAWVLITEWRDIGSYRRALGNFDVKIHAQALLSQSVDAASAFEVLIEAAPGAEPVRHASDHDLDRLDPWQPTETTP